MVGIGSGFLSGIEPKRREDGSMKRAYAAVGSLVAAAVIVGCGSSSSTNQSSAGASSAATGTTQSSGATKASHTFALIYINGQQSFFVQQAQGAAQEGSKLGVAVKDYNVNASSSATISDVQAAIAQHVDGLMLAPPSNSLGPRIVTLANQAHIPVIAIDNNFNGPNGKPVPLVGINAPAVGADSGKLLSSVYKKNGWDSGSTYYLSVELPGLQTCTQRTDAEKATFLQQNPTFDKSHILVVPYDGTVEKAISSVGPVVTAHPGVSHWLVASCNDDGVVGAGKALITAHVARNNIAGVGLGGDLVCTAWTPGAAPSGMVATNYFAPQDFGSHAVRVLYDNIVNHKPIPANTYVSITDITPSNFKSVAKC